MLIGANSRTVAAAVDAKIDDIRRTLRRTGLKMRSTDRVVDATITTVTTNPPRGRCW
jgi:cobalt-zinc-cadmium resistance protein CzcA